MKRKKGAAGQPAATAGDAIPSRSIYDGRHHLGEVFDLGCAASAQTSAGDDLGVFANVEMATQAILSAARDR